MSITPLEIIALIFALFGLIKLIVIFVNKKYWFPIPKKIYGSPEISSIVFIILALVIFYYILQELTIAQIFAVIAFSSLFMALAFLQYPKEFLALVRKAYGSKLSPMTIIYPLIWLLLMLWVLYEILST